jgi:protein phosphatase
VTNFTLPDLSLVVLIGPSGAGKSTFARKHFRATEILSSDFCRGLVRDDENDQSATGDAFDVLHYIAGKRLAAARLTVVDATNVQPESRLPLVALARQYHCLPVAIVLNVNERVCRDRNKGRADRNFGPHVVRNQCQQLRRSLRGLRREGFSHVFVLETPDEIDAVTVVRQQLWTNRAQETGPFDIIGDLHGCTDELEELLDRLGYAVVGTVGEGVWMGPVWAHPAGRKVIFLGDLVDRGPRILAGLRLVRNMVTHGSALCVPGNHDVKLVRKLRGKDVRIAHGLEQTLTELEAVAPADREAIAGFLDDLVSHYVLDGGKLVVAHAGMRAEMQGRASGAVRGFALYGETTGEIDCFGLPVRLDWAAEYRGPAHVAYGHTPVPEAEWLNRTINLDTGCVFGGKLTALRYPEMELVSVPARRTYMEPIRPFLLEPTNSRSAQQDADDVLDLADVRGKRILTTRLVSSVTIREENATAALEVMSRFAADPHWLIYLPPTMSPAETSQEPGLLEHPLPALNYYRQEGVPRVVCQEKHMGSRAVVIVCRDEESARKRFGVMAESGIVVTRTGRRFFEDRALEAALLDRVRGALSRAGFWEEFASDWFCLDCELMPWSLKAQELMRVQYAAVGAAASLALPEAITELEKTASRDATIIPLLEGVRERAGLVRSYVAAYRRYCWPVASVADLKLAPFHLLASEGTVHIGRDHAWHMDTLSRLCQGDEVLVPTASRVVDLADAGSVAEAVRWWEEHTERGGEGMVVKPLEWVGRGRRGLVQPGIKCRGREYLRIIYGPEYTRPENLERLRQRGLAGKRSLAVREFALGIEALERFVRREPLRRVHECVFGVLALESEPVDPRL